MARRRKSKQSNDLVKYTLIGVAVLAGLMLIINFAPTGKFVDAGNNIYVLDETVELTYSFASTEASLNNIYEPTTSKTHDSNIYSYSYLQSADSTYELTASEVSKTYEATGVTSDNTDSIPSCACDDSTTADDCDGEAATETLGLTCSDEFTKEFHWEGKKIYTTKYNMYKVLLEGEDLASCACDIDPKTNDCNNKAATETPGTSCYDEIEFTKEFHWEGKKIYTTKSGYNIYNVGGLAIGLASCACDIDPKTNDCNNKAATETPGTSCYDEIEFTTSVRWEGKKIDTTKSGYKVYNVLLEGEELASCTCDIDPKTNDCDGEAATETPGTSCYDEIEDWGYLGYFTVGITKYKVYNVGGSTAAGLASCACDIDPETNDCNNKVATETPGTSCYDQTKIQTGRVQLGPNYIPVFETEYRVYNVVGIDADLINKCDCDTTKDDDCTDELTKSSIGTQCYELVQIQTGRVQLGQNYIPVFGPAYNKYTVKAAKDEDGDGIIDQLDNCSGTTKGLDVDGTGCPIDIGLTPPTDTEVPIVLVPDDITVESTDGSAVSVTFIVTATDNFGVVSGPSCSPASKGSLVHPSPATGLSVSRQFTKKYTVGTTTVNCFAKDKKGHYGYNSFSVTVTTPVDTTPPIVLVPDDMTVESLDGLAVSVTFSVSATDNIGVVSGPTCDPASNSAFSVGTTTVSCLATDAAGNTGYKSFDIFVTYPPPVTTPVVPSDTLVTLVILNDVGNNQCSLAITVETSIADALIILQIKDANDLIVAYEYQTRSLVAGITQTLTIDKPNTASLCEGFLWEDWSGTPLTNKVEVTL